MRASMTVALALLLFSAGAGAETGVLIPSLPGRGEVEGQGVLALEHMDVTVDYEGGLAHMGILQIWSSQHAQDLEGRFVFRLPVGADLESFAIWEEGERVAGVIMERQKASDIYESLVEAEIDPGLVEASDEEEKVREFSCRVYPVPAYGTKRIELTYDQRVEVDGGQLLVRLPLAPTGSSTALNVQSLTVTVNVDTKATMATAEVLGERYPMTVSHSDGHRYSATFSGGPVALDRDLTFQANLDLPATQAHLYAFRDVDRQMRDISPGGGFTYRDETGFFLVELLFARGPEGEITPKDLILLLDTSLSMEGHKLFEAYSLAQDLLGRLSSKDRVQVILAGEGGQGCFDAPREATAEALAEARRCIDQAILWGGTDMVALLGAALKGTSQGRRREVVAITDGQPTMGELTPEGIKDAIQAMSPKDSRLFLVGAGDDADLVVLETVARGVQGFVIPLSSTDDPALVAQRLTNKLDAVAVTDLSIDIAGADNIVDTYPPHLPNSFGGSSVQVVGRYKEGDSTQVTMSWRQGGQVRSETVPLELPEAETGNRTIRRAWASARIQHLLAQIRSQGEQKELVQEVIRLARRFTFVTPYTSFIAAPRSMLRPRIIQPGDPILRVKTDPAVEAVVATFPFGLTEPMSRVPDEEGLWQLRFFAPANMADGRYPATLYLTLPQGQTLVERKWFIVDSSAPQIQVDPVEPLEPGRTVLLRARADSDTRFIYAKLRTGGACSLRYNHASKASEGLMRIPDVTPPGASELVFYAEDFAHNVTRMELPVEVLSRVQ